MMDFLSVNVDLIKIELLFIGERLLVPFVAFTVLIATFSFICHPPFLADVEQLKIEKSRNCFLITSFWPQPTLVIKKELLDLGIRSNSPIPGNVYRPIFRC